MTTHTTPGRNDACPCGSGKKFKRCCLKRDDSVDLMWHRLRRAEGNIVDRTVTFARKHYGDATLRVAWAAFTVWDEKVSLEDNSLDAESIFPAWFVFNWVHDEEDEEDDQPSQIPFPNQPLAMQCQQHAKPPFDALEKRFVHEACGRAYSFYAVTAASPEFSISLRDIMTGCEYTVLEKQASCQAQRGQIYFTRIIEIDGIALMLGCAPLAIPPSFHTRLIDLRDDIEKDIGPINEQSLHELDIDLREAYFAIRSQLMQQRMPLLQNTDGDPLLPTKLYFELACAPAVAVNALKSLSLGRADEEIESAEYASDGELHAARVSWIKAGNKQHENWDNTSLGVLHIEGKQLTAEVNSQARADRLRAEIETRLGENARFQVAVTESISKALEEHQNKEPSAKERKEQEENDRLRSLPEVQAHLRVMIEKHYEAWLDQSIPALVNVTPRQAAQDPKGRERLEAMLVELESMAARETDPLLRPDVAKLRRELGM